jgi:hypothetical protein
MENSAKREVGYYWVLLDKSKEVAYWNSDEWVMCGLELESHVFTDASMKYIDEYRIVNANQNKMRSKGDYMKAVQKLDPRIKEMDSAIPASYTKAMNELGIDSSTMVSMYWKDGGNEIVDVARHYVVMTQNL